MIKALTYLLLGGLVLVSLCLLCGCGEPRPPDQSLIPVTNGDIKVEQTDHRFKVEGHGHFIANYNYREILIITDTKTGKEYLGITGVGVTEMIQSGKTRREE